MATKYGQPENIMSPVTSCSRRGGVKICAIPLEDNMSNVKGAFGNEAAASVDVL